MMTRKHFKAIAALLKDLRDDQGAIMDAGSVGYREALVDVANGLADICAETNDNFDRTRFLRASCGVE